MELLVTVLGFWLAVEISIGNKVVIETCMLILCCITLVGYPMLATSSLLNVHGFAGNGLFYITFFVAYLSVAWWIVSRLRFLYIKFVK